MYRSHFCNKKSVQKDGVKVRMAYYCENRIKLKDDQR